jgi:hypothetical protein
MSAGASKWPAPLQRFHKIEKKRAAPDAWRLKPPRNFLVYVWNTLCLITYDFLPTAEWALLFASGLYNLGVVPCEIGRLSKGNFSCILMPAQLLPLTSPYFSNARDLGLTTSHEPLLWYPGPRALPYTSWVKLGEGPCASKKSKKKKKGGKGRPWEAAFLILLRQKWSDQSRRWSILSAAYSSDILEPMMK